MNECLAVDVAHLTAGVPLPVKSFGRRLASETRGTNPLCLVRGLWGFWDLVVPGVTGFAFTVLFGIAIPVVFPGDRVLIEARGRQNG